MPETIRLRPYQRECLDALHAAHDSGMRRPAVVLPTGAGKTIVFAAMAREHARSTGDRSMVLVHRDELADQAIEKIRDAAPGLTVGKVKAADDDVSADVVVASVQTLARSSRLQRLILSETDYQVPPFGLITTDECHHAAAPSYRKVYDAFPDARHAGFTATMARGDGVGLGSTWEDVVYSRTILHMIAGGYLTDVRGVSLDLEDLDLASVRITGGDYALGSLGDALETAHGPELVARAVHQHARHRRIVAFTPTVANAHSVAAQFDRLGITAAVVSGATPREERNRIYAASRSGAVQAMVNCQVLTEGFDAPWIDCVVVARPTRSAPLFVQMVGRGLRLWPGKEDCLVIDVSGSGGKLATLVDLAPGQVLDVREGETLSRAAVREEERKETRVRAGSLAFSLKHRDMDLFAAASQNWLTTDAGVLFIPVARSFLFLWPRENGTWDVGGAPPAGPWQRLRSGLPLGTAQAWAETFADERSPVKTDSSASWRRKAPTPGIMSAARSMGIDVPDSWRAGDVSDAIAVRNASRKFDDRLVRSTV